MDRSIPFGIGVLFGGIAWIEITTRFGRVSIAGLVILFGYALLGWFCYALSSRKSPRSASRILAFVLGCTAMTIQALAIRYIVANATDIQGFKSAQEFSAFVPTGRLLELMAWFFVPLILCSVTAGLIARRMGG